MGEPLSRRAQLVVARIVRERLPLGACEPLLARLPASERAAVISAVQAVDRWTMTGRHRRATPISQLRRRRPRTTQKKIP